MSGLKNDPAVHAHFNRYPNDRRLIPSLAREFTINWADRRSPANADLSIFLLQADKPMVDLFGFSQEVLAVYSPFRDLQQRVFQGIDALMAEMPVRGRADPMTCIVVSEDQSADDKVVEHLATNRDSRLLVGLSTDELMSDSDGWVFKNRLMSRLFGQDLFDRRLPLRNDIYFFGRDDVVQELQKALSSGENRGLFGLRKTGKTSIIYKLQRLSVHQPNLRYFHYDCKAPSVRMLTWPQLLRKVGNELATLSGSELMAPGLGGPESADAFLRIAESIPASITPILVFDEIEYITPYAKLDSHWQADFVPFWQTIWSVQSLRPLPVLLCGVSPSVVEADRVNGVQNPLFGIVPPRFLTGLGNAEVRRMLIALGGRMGLSFSDEAASYIHARYGGHPLLVRLASSLVHRSLYASQTPRPVKIDAESLRADEDSRDDELAFYCGHVVSELKDFYPDEYSLLEKVASGQTAEFIEFYRQPEFVAHLVSYGLVRRAPGPPCIAVPVVGNYVGLQAARSEGRTSILHVVPEQSRMAWLAKRVRAFIEDIRSLEALARRPPGVLLFGPNSFPEAEKLMQLSVCTDESSFGSFANILNRCFVESIEKYGQAIQKPSYFWSDIKSAYPELFNSLLRVKLYRHHRVHLVLNPDTDEKLREFLRRDLNGRNPSTVPDLWFVLQQCVLDNLFLATQTEIERLE